MKKKRRRQELRRLQRQGELQLRLVEDYQGTMRLAGFRTPDDTEEDPENEDS